MVYKRREVTASLTDQVVRYYTKKRYCVNKEIGLCRWGKLRADFIALNTKREIIIIEIKSCPADFHSDHKWEHYLPYCNKFYFCMNAETYNKVKDEIPKGIGVIIPNGFDLFFIKSAKKREVDLVKQLEILTRLAYRQAEYNRYR